MVEIPRELADVVTRYRRTLEAMGINAERIYLLGSHSTGTAAEGSDIDLIIISKDWERIGYLERFEMLGIAAARILEPVEAQGVTPGEIASGDVSPLLKHVLEREAILIH